MQAQFLAESNSGEGCSVLRTCRWFVLSWLALHIGGGKTRLACCLWRGGVVSPGHGGSFLLHGISPDKDAQKTKNKLAFFLFFFSHCLCHH